MSDYIITVNSTVDTTREWLAERGVPISSKVAEELAPSLTESDQKVISFINDVVTPNSSQINPPYPNGSAEVSDLINKLGEKVCYAGHGRHADGNGRKPRRDR